MKTVKTNKGTELPLLNLKGKDYLQVAHRIQWFVEENQNYRINTEFLVLSDEQTVAKATVTVYNDKNEVLRTAMATKRETFKQFADHTEKAETGAIGRALVELGYGTQYALSDLEEGTRLADSPLSSAKPSYAVTPKVPGGPINGIAPITQKAAPVQAVGGFKAAKAPVTEEEAF